MSSALLSPCGTYRYSLTRHIPSALRWVKPITFVMLNPSTADATNDDPTIRRCVYFATREGATELRVVNLFALRTKDPEKLLTHTDPVGPDNDTVLRGVSTLGSVVVAWGSHRMSRERAGRVVELLGGRELLCLGMNKDGSPKHPLYLSNDAPLMPWNGGSHA